MTPSLPPHELCCEPSSPDPLAQAEDISVARGRGDSLSGGTGKPSALVSVTLPMAMSLMTVAIDGQHLKGDPWGPYAVVEQGRTAPPRAAGGCH